VSVEKGTTKAFSMPLPALNTIVCPRSLALR
jgi:hypothetical protein